MRTPCKTFNPDVDPKCHNTLRHRQTDRETTVSCKYQTIRSANKTEILRTCSSVGSRFWLHFYCCSFTVTLIDSAPCSPSLSADHSLLQRVSVVSARGLAAFTNYFRYDVFVGRSPVNDSTAVYACSCLRFRNGLMLQSIDRIPEGRDW